MDLQPDTQTFLAVILGALLATAGGFSERQLERMLQRREKERSAALMFGELLNSMRVILRLGDETRGRGDPYGPITMRFVRAARREAEIYDRNRETLLDLHDAALRAQITVLVARIAFSLDGVLDTHGEIAATEQNLRSLGPNDSVRAEVEQHLAGLKETRKTAFDFAIESTEQVGPLLAALSPIAQHTFEATERAARQ